MSQREERRSARLLFGRELAGGLVSAAELDQTPVRRAVRSRRVPPGPMRMGQRLAAKGGLLDYERAVVPAFSAARSAVLGSKAAGPPRFIVRVDEFPHYRSYDPDGEWGARAYRTFHEILHESSVPYLVAVVPRIGAESLDPDATQTRELTDEEAAFLAELQSDGVELALHGETHRTRFADPGRHSELCGLSLSQLSSLLDRALDPLAALGIRPRVFVPPYNRFDAEQYQVLAQRFDVVCGGPESVKLMGFHRTPLWREDAVYLPSYPGLYGPSPRVAVSAARLIAADAALWSPIVLHWGWERRDDWVGLRELLAQIAPYAAPWSEFLAAVRVSA